MAVAQNDPVLENVAQHIEHWSNDPQFRNSQTYYQKVLAEGLAEGREEGELKKAREMVLNMLAADIPVDKIARISGLSGEEIMDLRDGSRKE